MTTVTIGTFILNCFSIASELLPCLLSPPSLSSFPPCYFFPIFFPSSITAMKKLGDIYFRVFNISVHLFSPIMYSLRDIEEIIFWSRVPPLSPTAVVDIMSLYKFAKLVFIPFVIFAFSSQLSMFHLASFFARFLNRYSKGLEEFL